MQYLNTVLTCCNMRYQSIYNEESNKYYILDTIRNAKISDYEYDIIIQIYADTYAVVGNKDTCPIDQLTEQIYYKYALIDMSGSYVLDMCYHFIYVHENGILCQYGDKVLEKTLLGQTIWHNKIGKLYINGKLINFDSEHAIIYYSLRIPEKNDINKRIQYYELIDVYGNVIDRDKTKIKLPSKHNVYPSMYSDDMLLIDYNTCKYGWNGRVNMINNKWLKIFNALENFCEDRMNYFNLTLPNGQRFEKFHYKVINNNFFLILQQGFADRFLCVMNNNMDILYYDPKGFYAKQIGYIPDPYSLHIYYDNSYIKTHLPKWICNDSCPSNEHPFFMNSVGEKFYLPSNVSIHSHTINNGYVPIFDEKKWGYINLHGEIVVPPIFEPIENRYIDIDIENIVCDGDGNRDNTLYSKLDAVDGDEEALWNLD